MGEWDSLAVNGEGGEWDSLACTWQNPQLNQAFGAVDASYRGKIPTYADWSKSHYLFAAQQLKLHHRKSQ